MQNRRSNKLKQGTKPSPNSNLSSKTPIAVVRTLERKSEKEQGRERIEKADLRSSGEARKIWEGCRKIITHVIKL